MEASMVNNIKQGVYGVRISQDLIRLAATMLDANEERDTETFFEFNDLTEEVNKYRHDGPKDVLFDTISY